MKIPLVFFQAHFCFRQAIDNFRCILAQTCFGQKLVHVLYSITHMVKNLEQSLCSKHLDSCSKKITLIQVYITLHFVKNNTSTEAGTLANKKSNYAQTTCIQAQNWGNKQQLSPLNTCHNHRKHIVHNRFNVCSNHTIFKLQMYSHYYNSGQE